MRSGAVVLAAAALMASCSADPVGQSSGAVEREAGAAVATKVAAVAFQAFTKIKSCMSNREIGQPCLASDSTNIRQTLKEVRQLSADVERNQQQVLSELDSLRAQGRIALIATIQSQLVDMLVNTSRTMKAYEALSDCLVTDDATCRPWDGKDNEPLVDRATAIARSKKALVEYGNRLPKDVPTTAAWFTGVDAFSGLADAIWMYNKGQQDSKAGVIDAAVKDSRTVPIITPQLARAQNEDLANWVDIYSEYGFFAVLHAGLTGGEGEARFRQNEVDSSILDESTRSSVIGVAKYYSVPPLLDGVLAIAVGDRTLMISNRTLSNSRPLVSDDVAALGIAINEYSTVEKFLKMSPATLPPGGRYETTAWVERVRYKFEWYEIRAGVRGPVSASADAVWLVEPRTTSDTCRTGVRLTNVPEARPSSAVDSSASFEKVEPSMTPVDRLLRTWERFAKDKPIAFNWSTSSANGLVGWGAWIKCDASFTGTVVELSTVPGVLKEVE